MGKKYIIELEDNESVYKTIISNGYPMIRVTVPTPYTEPDLEQIKADWYKAGREAERVRQPNLEQVKKEAYQKGLKDAWDAVRKIRDMSWQEQKEVFGTGYYADIIALPVSECIEKIKQYEQEKEGFHVGDEFEIETGQKFVIIKMEGNKIDRYIDENGTSYCLYYKYKTMRKTGRHFPEIAEVLAKMKEAQ